MRLNGFSRCSGFRQAISHRSTQRCGRVLRQRISAVGWDPEGLLSAPKGGHISRRFLQKEVEASKELQAEVDKLKQEKAEELRKQREARIPPDTQAKLIEYFLETESGEMQYEAARMRPLLTDQFFDFLSKEISTAKFSASPDEGRVAELEGLQEFLKDAIKVLDAKMKELSAPADKLKKLLGSTDKKATLLEMAGNNEIDKPLLDLLQQNIDAAKMAGHADAVTFMERIRDAARKYQLTTSNSGS